MIFKTFTHVAIYEIIFNFIKKLKIFLMVQIILNIVSEFLITKNWYVYIQKNTCTSMREVPTYWFIELCAPTTKLVKNSKVNES